jgi:hypothetical protein
MMDINLKLHAVDNYSVYSALKDLVEQIGEGKTTGTIEQYPFYTGQWNLTNEGIE